MESAFSSDGKALRGDLGHALAQIVTQLSEDLFLVRAAFSWLSTRYTRG